MGKPQMPEPDYGNRRTQDERNRLIHQYGEATVFRAELTALLFIVVKTGVIKGDELLFIVKKTCENIDEQRRNAADPLGRLQ